MVPESAHLPTQQAHSRCNGACSPVWTRFHVSQAASTRVFAGQTTCRRRTFRTCSTALYCVQHKRAMTDHLEEQQRQVFVPSEEDFVARVREVEQERARTASRIDEQREAAEAKERDIERMRASADETETEIERTVDAHTVEMPRVQNSIGLYAHITGIKWNYETEGEIMAGWLLPRGGSSTGTGKRAAARGAGDRATVEGFQFDAAGKGDFEVANKLWDIIDGRERALVEV